MDNKLAIIEAAIAEGLDPANLAPAQYNRLAIKIRSAKQLVRDGSKVVGTKLRKFMGRTVSLKQIESNKAFCYSNQCGRFREMTPKTKVQVGDEIIVQEGKVVPACDACNCSGKNLEAKWGDPVEGYCPLGFWSNLGKDEQGRAIVPHGDAISGV